MDSKDAELCDHCESFVVLINRICPLCGHIQPVEEDDNNRYN